MMFEVRFRFHVTEPDPELRADLLERDAAYVEKHFSDRWRVLGADEELILIEAGDELDSLLKNRPLYPYSQVEVRPLIR